MDGGEPADSREMREKQVSAVHAFPKELNKMGQTICEVALACKDPKWKKPGPRANRHHAFYI